MLPSPPKLRWALGASLLAIVARAQTAPPSPPDDPPPPPPAAGDTSPDDQEAAEPSTPAESNLGPLDRRPPRGKGVLWGLVSDSATGEPLPDVEIDVVGTEYGTVTDQSGQYRLELPPGTHQLRVWAEAHRGLRVHKLWVRAEGVRKLEMRLEPSDEPADEIVVEAKPDASSVDAVTLDRKKSTSVGDAVGRTEIVKSADRDAAQAAKRVVGATIVGNRFVYVRGLGERYTNAQLNDAPLPSPEPDRAAVPLDLFPTAVLERLTIVKTFTPDFPGDFAGGSVRITTRSVPDKFMFQGVASLGYDTNSTGRERLSYRGGSTDWLGFDDGTRRLPDSIPADQSMTRRQRPDGTWVLDRDLVAPGRDLNTYMSAVRRSTLPNHSLSMVIGDGWKVGPQRKLGYIASLNYQRGFRIRHEIRREFEADSTAPDGLAVNKDVRVETGNENVNWGAFGSLMYERARKHKFNLILLHSQLADNDAQTFDGYWRTNAGDLHTTRLKFVSRALNVVGLQGEQKFADLGDAELSWNLSYSLASRSEPNTRDVVYMRNDQGTLPDGTTGPAYVFFDSSESGSHFYSQQDERSLGAGVNWTQPLRKGPAPTALKGGGSVSLKHREFWARRLPLRRMSGAADDPFVCPGETYQESCADKLFVPSNIGTALGLRESTRPEDAYTAELNVLAGYLMADAHLMRDLRLIAGARAEGTDQSIDPVDQFRTGVAQRNARLSSLDLLPALGLVYSSTRQSKLRFSLTRTLARPQLRELAPFAYSDFFGGRLTSGNPDLRLTHIINGDLRFEYFPELSETLAFSFFYKRFIDAIEPVVTSSGDRGLVTFQNAPAANLLGLELEARLSAKRLYAPARHFSVVANLTLGWSRIAVDQTDRDYLTSLSRPMVNQAPYVANLALDYDNPDLGFQSRVSYNVRGPQLVQVGARGLDDSWEHPVHGLDVAASKDFGKHWKVRLGASNLLRAVRVVTVGRERTNRNVELRYRDGIGVSASMVYTY